ncbi:Putative periplasmic protein [hydrothermal vent metagenome]|uniref:Putative periplasmic protein n=1 Tax=hydrothermal vent metagenome TaxID=652676 RepID=A0A1W1BX45_9ZZZZ
MLRTLFALLGLWVCSITAFADENASISESNTTSQTTVQKVLYLSYYDLPKRVIKGEVFSVTIKTVAVVKDFEEIEYSLLNAKGVKVLNDAIPYRKENANFLLDTFYFQATDTDVRLPDITATLKDYFGTNYKPATLKGKRIDSISLNPKEDFCNIIAKDFRIKYYKTTAYDDAHNIVVFIANAKNTLLKEFHLQNVYKQGVESLSDSIESSQMTYYVVIDKKIENLHFSYFNTLKNSYITLNIPIIVDDDRVTTQSDLKPKDNSKKEIKMLIAAAIILVGVVLLLWRERLVYILLIILPGIYVIYLIIPPKQVCIKEGSKIRILPLQNSTVFEVTQKKLQLDKIGVSREFIKVELPDNKIGWVKNEDLCTH